MTDLHIRNLAIGEVARRTGVAPSTLRMWEQRHGFPRAHQAHSGHRRFSDDDCRAIASVTADRAGGLSLPAAIARATAARRRPVDSVFDELLRVHPELATQVLPGRFMLSLSRAIEDHARTYGARGVLIGAFERRASFGAARRRWQTLARQARMAIVFADFERATYDHQLWRVPVGADSPLASEWIVVCDAPQWSACIVGREKARSPDDPTVRVFDATWTLRPDVARSAARAAVTIAGQHRPAILEECAPLLRTQVQQDEDTPSRCTEFVDQVLDDLLRQGTGRRRRTPPE